MVAPADVRLHRVCHVASLTAIAVLLAVVYERRPKPPPPPPSGVLQEFQTALIQRTDNFGTLRWMGEPIWQPPLDLWELQEAIYEVRPALLIECGTYKGGSSLFVAHLFDIMRRGRVVTVDIEKQHNLSHPRITYLIGDCAAPQIVQQIRAEATKAGGPVMVVLDSDHSAGQVSRELAAYHALVSPGSYLHVQDGAIDVLPFYTGARPGPLVAIEAFLATNADFEVDTVRTNRFIITQHPKGWLRRRSGPRLFQSAGAP
jgi:cephalosporin hydroxylase